jgi:hypothetical protein
MENLHKFVKSLKGTEDHARLKKAGWTSIYNNSGGVHFWKHPKTDKVISTFENQSKIDKKPKQWFSAFSVTKNHLKSALPKHSNYDADYDDPRDVHLVIRGNPLERAKKLVYAHNYLTKKGWKAHSNYYSHPKSRGIKIHSNPHHKNPNMHIFSIIHQ